MSGHVSVYVVGAGPAGLMSAIAAAQAGAQVTLFERLPRPGTKLVATGGGRCNLTNALPTVEFLERFGKKGKFMRPALESLDSPSLRRFFKALGVKTHSADHFHYFPISESAVEIRDTLLVRCRHLNVEIRMGQDICALLLQDGAIRGIETDQRRLESDRVILATGGCAWPELGSNGSGFALARGAGHTIIAPAPALVPLITRQDWPRRCAGIVIPNARIRIDLPKASRAGVTGDLLFTHRGLSGPAALDLSGEVARGLMETELPAPLILHLTPECNPEVWAAQIKAWCIEYPKRLIKSFVAGHLPHSLADIACDEIGISTELRAADLPRASLRRLAHWLSGVPVEVERTEGFSKAMVCSGGVSLRDIAPRTLQSRLIHGLYFAGEILDIDGPCGGYNLQWAFSSGWLAGHSAAQSTKE